MKAFVFTAVLTSLLAAQATLANTNTSTEVSKSCHVEAVVAAMRTILQDKLNRKGIISDLHISESGIEVKKVSSKRVSTKVTLSLLYNYNSNNVDKPEMSDHVNVAVDLNKGKNSCTAISTAILSEE